jgi:hypothetical protein
LYNRKGDPYLTISVIVYILLGVTIVLAQGGSPMTVNRNEFGEAAVFVIYEYSTPFNVTEITDTRYVPATSSSIKGPALNNPLEEIDSN